MSGCYFCDAKVPVSLQEKTGKYLCQFCRMIPVDIIKALHDDILPYQYMGILVMSRQSNMLMAAIEKLQVDVDAIKAGPLPFRRLDV